MTNTESTNLKQVLQVGLVVKDAQKSAEQYWQHFGIGPWQFYVMEPPQLRDTMVRGKPEPYSMKVALAHVGEVQIELIEPLSGESIYKEFLEQRGEGLHHIACAVDDYDQAMTDFQKQNVGVLMGGKWIGATFSYLDSESQLGTIVEVFKMDPGFELPPPVVVYPPSE